MQNLLLIIDPQNDFCDVPKHYRPLNSHGVPASPSLPVLGAHEDMRRLAGFIELAGERLSSIVMSLDAHHRFDIAHPPFWQYQDGSPVPPFTPVLPDDVHGGRILPRDLNQRARVTGYLEALREAGRYTHMVWPVHCEIGTWGQAIHEDVSKAAARWEEAYHRFVGVFFKGMNPWTEHYSVVRAEVPDPNDQTTLCNRAFLSTLEKADRILVAGEAASHCVRATIEHALESFPKEMHSRFTLLLDGTSPVTGFEAQYRVFLEDIRGRGVQLKKIAEVLPDL